MTRRQDRCPVLCDVARLRSHGATRLRLLRKLRRVCSPPKRRARRRKRNPGAAGSAPCGLHYCAAIGRSPIESELDSRTSTSRGKRRSRACARPSRRACPRESGEWKHAPRLWPSFETRARLCRAAPQDDGFICCNVVRMLFAARRRQQIDYAFIDHLRRAFEADRLDAHVVGAGIPMRLHARADRRLVAPADVGVDEAV